jgi:metal-dependent amidase/aminoacylase/carboxypeptidase family protein
MDAVMGAEDFSYFGTKAPALFLYVGGMKKGQDPATAFPHHTADFVIDESGMKTGVRTLCNLVMDYLNKETVQR